MANLIDVLKTLRILLVAILKTRPLTRKPGKPRKVLYLAKPIFNDDIAQIDRASEDLVFLRFPRLELSKVVRLAVNDFDALSDQSYWDYLSEEELKKVAFLVRIFFSIYRVFYKFDAVVSGNYTYVSQQGFAEYCLKEEIPFVVLYKEGTLIKFRDKKKQKKLFDGKRFLGSHLLLPNHTTKALFEQFGTFQSNDVDIRAVGIPRFEIYKEPMPAGEHIVFFYFDPLQKAGIANETFDGDPLFVLNEQLKAILADLVFASKHHPIVIKTKNKNELDSLLAFMSDNNIQLEGSNVRFDSTSDAFLLLRQAFCVIGNFSTTLVEARLAGRRVFAPLAGLHDGDPFFLSIGVKDVSEFKDLIGTELRDLDPVEPDLVSDVSVNYASNSAADVAAVLSRAVA